MCRLITIHCENGNSVEKPETLLQQHSNTFSVLLDARINTAYNDITSVSNGTTHSGNSTLEKRDYRRITRVYTMLGNNGRCPTGRWVVTLVPNFSLYLY